MPTTIGQILVNSVLPERFRDYNRALGADELEDLLKRIIKEDPDSYREVSAKLMRLGARAAYDTGTTLKLSDLEAPFDNTEMYRRLDQVEDAIQNDKTLTPAQKREKLADIYDQVYTETKKKAYTVADSKGNGFAMQVKSKARGNQDQLSAMINTPGTYKDPKGNTVPMFIRHSYAEGLNPAEYWAGSYGARTGVTCLALDTEVLMGDWSVKKIIDIKPGDTVMGSNANGQMYPVSVLRVYDNGVQPVYRFSFRVGSSRNNFIHVDATEEHKMLARICSFGGSRRDGTRKPYSMSDPALVKLAEAIPNQKRLENSKYVAQMALDAYNPNGGIHNKLALLLGLIAGDGCCSPTSHGSITISCADSELISDISGYLHGLGITLRKSKGNNYNWVLVRADDCPITWCTTRDGRKFNNKTRAAVWEVYGGCLSHTKDIPEGIWGWDNESILAYLSGIIATDGSIYQTKYRQSHCFSFAVNSLKLLLGVKQLLERRFGIFCGAVHEMQHKRVHHMYGITIDHPKAAEKFFRLFEAIVPGVKKHALKQAHGVIGSRSKDIGCRIAKKEFLGNLPVMDIEVDSQDHMFVLANGLISSNSTKFATANAGALGKLFSSASIEQVVTEDDCNTIAGMPVKTDDKDNIGCVLASDIGGYKAGTVITKSVVSDLQKQKVEDILVRSPITCGAKNGVCSHCAGIRENGKFPEIGYNLGLNAASALAERIAQGSLNCLAEGTLVRMADGSAKPIEKVEPGELVLGSDLNGNVSPTRVVARYDNGIQPCVSTRFVENGTDNSTSPSIVLESTVIHKILGTQVITEQPDEKLNWVPRMLEVGCESPEFYAYIVYFHNGMNTPEVKQHKLSKMLAEHLPESEKCSLIAFKRVEQKDIGLHHVYDLEVECKDHIYLLANGLIVHNTKHSGKKLEGVHGSYSGFDMLKSMATVPKVYKDKATVSEIDGTVEKIEKAPQGGSYVWVNDQKFYVPHGYDILVKQGDTVEAGDQLSDGVINPADAVRLKGIGEGRRYFTQRFTKAYRDSGYKGSRRNVEALSKSLIDNVVIDDPDAEGQMLPGDLVSYSRWSWGYKPRPNSVQDAPNKALGKYLEQPALHYSIGTRVTKKVIDELNKFKVPTVLYNENPPGVHPDMRSIVETTGQTDDWMGRLGTTYIGKRLIEDVQQGAESNSKGLNPYPAVAKGTTLGQWGTPGHQNEEFHY
jgi:hypothetical protein